MPQSSLHPQSLTCEMTWTSNWFQRLLKFHQEGRERERENDQQIYIADRSPYSAVFYAHHGHLLGPVIDEQINELRKIGIHIVTVHIKVQAELLWERIQSRLHLHPERRLYNEHKKEWMEEVQQWYNGYSWDVTLDNDTDSLPDLLHRTVDVLREKYFSIGFKVPVLRPPSPVYDRSEEGRIISPTKA
mmetsp:Transcript_43048/g.111465  ORF Transcript_43048/g.111465 Transcript_43048/m.111465 type:complete len:188 (-) Transcript_43048:1736-2299(-)